MYRTPVPPARQDGFDQIPAHVQRRDDLTSGAKRLYGLLCSVQRMKIERDYRWLAAELAASVRSIVRWVQQLVAAGLVTVRRRGQGLTNLFVVLGLVTTGMDMTATPRVTGSQPPARANLSPKENTRRSGSPARKAPSDYARSPEGGSYMLRGGVMVLVPPS
jgi:hypothetical protein